MHTQQEYDQLWDKVIDLDDSLKKIAHLAQEALDGTSLIANLSQPHINRIRAQIRDKSEKRIFDSLVVCFKQVQQRIAIIVEEASIEEEATPQRNA